MKTSTPPALSTEAIYVLHHLQNGCRLVGSILKRGTPFVLEFRRGSENVDFMIAAELIDHGHIVAMAAREPDNAEYHLRGGSGVGSVQDQ